MKLNYRFDIFWRATPAKKARQGRATAEQIEAMVDYFIINPHVATGKFIGLHEVEMS